MFYASSRMDFGSVLMTTRLAVGRSVRIYVAERHGMSADSNLFPSTQEGPRAVTLLWLLLSGTVSFEHNGTSTRIAAPALVSLPEHWNEGARGTRAVRIQTGGAPFSAVQVLYRAPCEGLGHVALSDTHLGELKEMHRRILDVAPEDGSGLLRALLWKLVSFGLVPPHALQDSDPSLYTDPATVRMWNALQTRYNAIDASPSLKAMAAEANLSCRHAHRIMGAIFNECLMPPGGFREATINVRLSLASLLLSKSALSVSEVARLVGYMHPETLANAFRHVGLPSPAEIRRSYATETVLRSENCA